MAYKPKRFSPLRRPRDETVDQLGQRLDRVQDALKAQLDPMSTALSGAGSSSGGSATLSDTPALALAAAASAGTSDEASRADHRHPLPAPLLVANGGTGLTAVGTAYQVLRTNAAATAMEWDNPYSVASVVCLPNGSASLGATQASFVGVPAYGASTTYDLGFSGSVDRLFAVPWVAPYTKSISTVLWELTTGAAGLVVNFALYESDADGYPTNRLAAVSGVSLTATGMKTSAFSSAYTVQRGRLYWLGRTTNSTAAQARCWISPTFSGLGIATSAANLNFTVGTNPQPTHTHLRVAFTYAAPPSTFPTGATPSGLYFPIQGLF